jgi:hypothetical protein
VGNLENIISDNLVEKRKIKKRGRVGNLENVYFSKSSSQRCTNKTINDVSDI